MRRVDAVGEPLCEDVVAGPSEFTESVCSDNEGEHFDDVGRCGAQLPDDDIEVRECLAGLNECVVADECSVVVDTDLTGHERNAVAGGDDGGVAELAHGRCKCRWVEIFHDRGVPSMSKTVLPKPGAVSMAANTSGAAASG